VNPADIRRLFRFPGTSSKTVVGRRMPVWHLAIYRGTIILCTILSQAYSTESPLIALPGASSVKRGTFQHGAVSKRLIKGVVPIPIQSRNFQHLAFLTSLPAVTSRVAGSLDLTSDRWQFTSCISADGVSLDGLSIGRKRNE
jgi:hypothetical protein